MSVWLTDRFLECDRSLRQPPKSPELGPVSRFTAWMVTKMSIDVILMYVNTLDYSITNIVQYQFIVLTALIHRSELAGLQG